MSISSEDCKKAIVAFVKERPGLVASMFDVSGKEVASFEKPATTTSNWKRVEKSKVHELGKFSPSYRASGKPLINFRFFDCRPYDDQLRGYTWDDGKEILLVIVQGE